MDTIEILKKIKYKIEEKADDVHCKETLESKGYYNSADMISDKINELETAHNIDSKSAFEALLIVCRVRDIIRKKLSGERKDENRGQTMKKLVKEKVIRYILKLKCEKCGRKERYELGDGLDDKAAERIIDHVVWNEWMLEPTVLCPICRKEKQDV